MVQVLSTTLYVTKIYFQLLQLHSGKAISSFGSQSSRVACKHRHELFSSWITTCKWLFTHLPKQFTLHEKLNLHKFTRCKYGAKKMLNGGKSKAKMVNTTSACQFTWGCKCKGNCRIYHLCPLFNLSLHFFCTKFTLSKFGVNTIFRAVLSGKIISRINS